MKNSKIRIQINSKNFRRGNKLFPIGSKVIIEVDKKRQPIDTFWKQRLEDAKIDNCVSIVKKSKVVKEKKVSDKNKDKENK